MLDGAKKKKTLKKEKVKWKIKNYKESQIMITNIFTFTDFL